MAIILTAIAANMMHGALISWGSLKPNPPANFDLLPLR